MIDTTEIGNLAAKVMESLEEMQNEGVIKGDARVNYALIIYEVEENDGSVSMVGGQVTEGSTVIGLGLIERIRHIMLNGLGLND